MSIPLTSFYFLIAEVIIKANWGLTLKENINHNPQKWKLREYPIIKMEQNIS